MRNKKTKTKKELSYNDVKIGDVFSFRRKIAASDVKKFARLSGDRNPLHLDERYAQGTVFGKRIVHGMLLGSFFSRLVGTRCPARGGFYLGQTLSFRRPVYLGESVLIKGVVLSKSAAGRVVTLKTEILKGRQVAVSGEAKVIFFN